MWFNLTLQYTNVLKYLQKLKCDKNQQQFNVHDLKSRRWKKHFECAGGLGCYRCC